MGLSALRAGMSIGTNGGGGGGGALAVLGALYLGGVAMLVRRLVRSINALT